MSQEIKNIKIEDLVLWTENPRDPIDEKATDQEVVNRALKNVASKWNLQKLAKEMGAHYDFSELPTVVYHDKKPIVYDGNRRIALGKIKHGFVSVSLDIEAKIPDFPIEIPCNVCSKKIALSNVYRKHSGTGSWQPLERDLFLHNFMGEEPSAFLSLDLATGLIRENPHLNQRFVKDEVLTKELLKDMGFSIKKGKLHSVFSETEEEKILSDISEKVKNKDITTRKKRGKVIETLDPSSQKLINECKGKSSHASRVTFNKPNGVPAVESMHSKDNIPKPIADTDKKRLTKRSLSNQPPALFGDTLYLKVGKVSNLYRDIIDLYGFYIDNKNRLSETFRSLIRMSLRLLCETAAKDKNMKLENYLKNNFAEAKKTLSRDSKTTLSNQNVSGESIIQLLHTGAHDYSASSNFDQTVALSIIIGAILTKTHGKDK